MTSQYVRQTAIPCSVLEISGGAWVQNDGLAPSGVQTDKGFVSRASIIGIVVEKRDVSFSLDDGTNIINVRSFDPKPNINVEIGDVVLLIGRPREYNQERYIVLEIVKRLHNHSWLHYRKRELDLFAQLVPAQSDAELERKRQYTAQIVAAAQATAAAASMKAHVAPIVPTQGVSVEELVQETAPQNPFEKVMAAIRQLDAGSGADMEEVIAVANHPETEQLLKTLLEEGEIFEVRPGMIKVLE